MAGTTPRDAATIVVTRPGASGLEVLLVRRHGASGFMAGAFVFPGGKVDAADRVSGESPEAAFLRAACRETAEEAGIRVTPDALVYWAHWITPSAEPKRFDTRFFVVSVPPDQTPSIDAREVTEARWTTCAAALEAHARGEIFLPPPTQRTLEELSPFGSFAEIRAAASSRTIAPVMPKLTALEDGFAILLPWDPEYAATEGEGLPWPGRAPSGASRITIRIPRG